MQYPNAIASAEKTRPNHYNLIGPDCAYGYCNHYASNILKELRFAFAGSWGHIMYIKWFNQAYPNLSNGVENVRTCHTRL